MGIYLAEHLASLQHDNVQYFLKTTRFTPRQLWQQVRAEFVASARGYVLFDDTVLDKRHSQPIKLVRLQYSGNAHGIIKGIGLVNCVCQFRNRAIQAPRLSPLRLRNRRQKQARPCSRHAGPARQPPGTIALC